MKISLTMSFLFCSVFLCAQNFSVMTKDNRIKKDFCKRYRTGIAVIEIFFKTDRLDTIATFRSDLSAAKIAFVRYDLERDSIHEVPDEYNLAYDFFKGGKLVDSFVLRISNRKSLQDSFQHWNINGLNAIGMIIRGESAMTRDRVVQISEQHFPGKETEIYLDSNFNPLDVQRTVRYYWCIKKKDDLSKDEYHFIEVDLKTGEIEIMVHRSGRTQ